ncbi:Zinc finger, C2H2-type/integrase, DNA-binding protein [Metarhizium album ARSEF 1941]|uniref:Zinc finger, C2H2-type/integrase, DNA-binding protein n=1 Tax=Metarhizium album (strain ARSEF 1941) TaxID=1081103 RepID=A0A0B2WKC6_METAS|nr:Zinc finger, C2H2-type/integrase, DNA-binding protein [Metarhizium album ARSEF 1941]KHN94373.1 Zinc finger, C2H2-type/integrase, DNA-binding protein [Metarhizium album ARSEF 1941]
MAFPPRYREPPPSLPSIISSGPGRYDLHHDVPFPASSAMSIPRLDQKDVVPPPLPPPRHLPFLEGPAHSTDDSKKESMDCSHFGSSAHSGYGSMQSGSFVDERSSCKRRGTGSSANGDEGYASYTATESTRDPRPTEFLHRSKFHFQTAADLHGDSMKKKLDPIAARTFDMSTRSATSSALSEQVRRQSDPRAPALSIPVQMPIHTRSLLDSPARITDAPMFSAVSPRSTPFRHLPGDNRMSKDGLDFDQSPRHRSGRNNSDDASSSHGSYEFTGAEDMEIDGATSPKRLYPDETYATVGHKRRAASPPSGETVLHGGSSEVRRRDLGSRGSPAPRLTLVPQTSSLSSSAVSRSNSYISTMSMAPSSATTTTSFSRRSPGAASPGGVSPTSCNSPYTTPVSLNHSPRNSISGRGGVHGRTVCGTSPRKLADIQKPAGAKVQRLFMCDCCPKKPKKFDTAEELSAHEAEKQYECSFCGNRFKNKNEAERHQNSLHVRRHSWSCSAISGYDRAFHESTSHPGEADTCGYCGDEFPRSGRGPGNGAFSRGVVPKQATDQDWDDRIRHLLEVHKFRECNSSKKFYRADHFRQHLKHSHAGTSGKWTNMLENACMMDEDPTPR